MIGGKVETFKRWGLLRKNNVDFVLAQHPGCFSDTAMSALNWCSDAGTGPTGSLFMEAWNKVDWASTASTFETSEAAGVDASVADAGAENGPVNPTMQELCKLKRFFTDESAMLALGCVTRNLRINNDWGYQMSDAVKIMLDSSLDHTSDSFSVSTATGLVWDVLDTVIGDDQLEFAALCLKVLYSGSPLASTLPTNVVETVGACIGGAAECGRFVKIPFLITAFVLQRILDASLTTDVIILKNIEHMIDSKQVSAISDEVNRVKVSRDQFLSLWQTLMRFTQQEEIDMFVEGLSASARTEAAAAASTMQKVKQEQSEAAAVGAEPSPQSSMRFIADVACATIPGTSGTPAQFRALTSYVEHSLTLLLSPGSDSMLAEYGWSQVYEDAGKLYASKIHRATRFNFYGAVSMLASEGSIKLGAVLGSPLYVNSKSLPGNPMFLPSWGVKVYRCSRKATAAAAEVAEQEAAMPMEPENVQQTQKDPEEKDPEEKDPPEVPDQPEGNQQQATSEPSQSRDVTTGQGKAKAKAKAKPKVKATAKTMAAKAKAKAGAAGAASSKQTSAPADESQQKQKHKGIDGPSLEVRTSQISLSLKELKKTKLLKTVPDSISIVVTYLTPAASVIGQEDVLLQRPIVPGMISKARAAEILEAQQSKARQSEHVAPSPASKIGGAKAVQANKHMRL